MKSSVTKPAAAVEQCQVKSRKSGLHCLLPCALNDLVVFSICYVYINMINSHCMYFDPDSHKEYQGT